MDINRGIDVRSPFLRVLHDIVLKSEKHVT